MSGLRGRHILENGGKSSLRERLAASGMELGELFASISGLYFRGKLADARRYGSTACSVCGAYVITSCGGLLPPETRIMLDRVREICAADIDCANASYRTPLERDLRQLSNSAPAGCDFVLLGSIATSKYLEPLLRILGDRLFFPEEFIGRGDMSRGGLLLRCVEAGRQLTYIPASTATRHGPRPPKLPRQKRTA
jgi:hypothetical protein